MLSKSHETVVVFILILGQLMTQVGLSQGLSTLLDVEEHFEIDNPGEVAWSVVAYALSQCTFYIVTGKLGDMFGHKKLFVFGYFILAFWSLITCASYFATGSTLYYIARGFQGFGSSFITPNALAIIACNYDPSPLKTVLFAAFGAATPIGFVLGALFGALFSNLKEEEWFWLYFAMSMFCASLTILSFVFIPTDKLPKDCNNQVFDALGAITGIVGIFTFNAAWNLAAKDGWNRAYTYILLIVSLISLCSFVYVEMKSDFPLIPVQKINFPLLRILGCIAFGFGAFGIWLFYIWIFMLRVQENSALVATSHFSPLAITGGCAVALTYFLCFKNVKTNYIILIALLCILAPLILLATVKEDEIYWASVFVSVSIAPFSINLMFSTATLMLSNSVAHNQQGISSALVATVSSFPFGLGIAGNAAKYLKPEDDLETVRYASYVGIGFCCLGIGLAVYGVICDFICSSKSKSEDLLDEQSTVLTNNTR